MSERGKPEDMQCIFKVMALIIREGTYYDVAEKAVLNEERTEVIKDAKFKVSNLVMCDGDKCAQWAKGSGLLRCGMRQT